MTSDGKRTVVVVGGGGFLGSKLASACLASGYADVVKSLDVQFPSPPSSRHVEQVHCDLATPSCAAVLLESITDARCVFLVASYGMSGHEQLNKSLVRAVNLHGARRVLDACIAAGVPQLVYTSTYNVIFYGQPIRGLGERQLSYCTAEDCVDEYSWTKTQAERMVLEANSDRLMTAAVRPAAIWGGGESRHMARVNELIDAGLFAFRFGTNPIVDFVHVSNLVHAHMLVAVKLEEERDEKWDGVAGQAFFVSDGQPRDNFEFFAQLAEVKSGGSAKSLSHVPLVFVYAFAIVCEWVHRMLGIWRAWMLTKAEVNKAGIEHHCSIEQARRCLGYEPMSYAFDEVIDQWCKESRAIKRSTKKHD